MGGSGFIHDRAVEKMYGLVVLAPESIGPYGGGLHSTIFFFH